MTRIRLPRLSTAEEPVLQSETIKAGVSALVAFLVAFGIFTPSPAQVVALIGLLTFVGGILAKRARSKVTPVPKAARAIVNAFASGHTAGVRFERKGAEASARLRRATNASDSARLRRATNASES